MNDIGLKIGQYIFYPAMILLLLIILIVVTVFFIAAMKAKANKRTKMAYGISGWQKQELPETINYVRNEIDNEVARQYCADNEKITDGFCDYLARNKVWDYAQITNIAENAPFVISKILFQDAESSITEYEDGEERALLLLNSIDLVNGGPVYEGKVCKWMMDDIEEYPDSNTPPVQNKVKTVFQQALINIFNQMGEDEGQINEAYDLPFYIKGYTKEALDMAAGELAEFAGFNNISPETRMAIIHGLLFTLHSYFEYDDEDVEEIQICYIRCLMCILSRKMYEDVTPILNSYRV